MKFKIREIKEITMTPYKVVSLKFINVFDSLWLINNPYEYITKLAMIDKTKV